VAKIKGLCGEMSKSGGCLTVFKAILTCMLKALETDLKKWNDEVFGNVEK
jgi:hypothetical protein